MALQLMPVIIGLVQPNVLTLIIMAVVVIALFILVMYIVLEQYPVQTVPLILQIQLATPIIHGVYGLVLLAMYYRMIAMMEETK
jgi:hypothetical protein